jgi:hypothetical protein
MQSRRACEQNRSLHYSPAREQRSGQVLRLHTRYLAPPRTRRAEANDKIQTSHLISIGGEPSGQHACMHACMNLPRPRAREHREFFSSESAAESGKSSSVAAMHGGISSVRTRTARVERSGKWKRHVLLPASGSSARATHVPAGNAACE